MSANQTTQFINEDSNSKAFAGLNLSIKFNGEMVNLGSLFTTNNGSTRISKELVELIRSGEVKPEALTVAVTGAFSSEDTKEEVSADSFA